MTAITLFKATVTSSAGEKKADIEITQQDTLAMVMQKVKKVTVDKDLFPKGIPVENQLLEVTQGSVHLAWKYKRDTAGELGEQVMAQGLSTKVMYKTRIPNTSKSHFVLLDSTKHPYLFDNVLFMDIFPDIGTTYDIVYMAIRSLAKAAVSGTDLSEKELKDQTQT